MVKCGFTSAGTQRWKCSLCLKVSCRKRKDVSKNNTSCLMRNWLLGMNSISDIAKKIGITRRALTKRFSNIKKLPRIPLKKLGKEIVLILDGTQISKNRILLVVYELVSEQPLAWAFTNRECFNSWFKLLSTVKAKYQITALASDGQKGLIKAIQMLFPGIPHQRCLIHIVRRSTTWLTRRPKTEAGIELRAHILKLKYVKSVELALAWKEYFKLWDKKHHEFLKEKSINPLTQKSWFTHRRIRSIRSLIKNALEGMFWYTTNPNIPNTTNAVEGGINSELSELLRRHRGVTIKQKEALATCFLYSKRNAILSTRKFS